jgi:hypothetical protein
MLFTMLSSLQDWTGWYEVALFLCHCPLDDLRRDLPSGLNLDPNLAGDTGYPLILSFGAVEDAHPRSLEINLLNYCESFSAVPGIYAQQSGPYLHPLLGYLNKILPVLLGRASGYPKMWSRVERKGRESFHVQTTLGAHPVLDARFQLAPQSKPALENARVQRLIPYLHPNVIGRSLFGGFAKTIFTFDWESGTAWDIESATLDLHDDLFAPGFHDKTLELGVHARVPWRLRTA